VRVEIITYREYVGVSSALLLFVALVAPDVICPDRRQHVLPLLFSRPMTGVDYVFAKLGAIASIVFAFSFLPQVVLFVGNMFVSNSAQSYFTGHLGVLWKVPVAVFLLAIYYAVIGVAISSLSDRRIVAGASIIGLFLVTSIASAAIVGENYQFGGGSPAALLNLLRLPLELRDLVFLGHIDPEAPLNGVANGGLLAVVTYVAVLLAGIGLLLRRYRWVER
jgi:ABC-2 type transport system permease protein